MTDPVAAPVLEVRDLHTYIATGAGVVRAVDGVSFTVGEREIVGLVGESGCGKSVTCRTIAGLMASPPARSTGSVRLASYGDRNLLDLSAADLQRLRGAHLSMVFQDPMSALNPVMRVGAQIEEAVGAHEKLSGRARRTRAIELMERVGIPVPERRMRDYPHQFSGGMRQRVLIAMAIAGRPKLLLADEPTTALDVLIQDQILSLLLELQRDFGMSMILVSHDLGVIGEMCDRVAVMYAGRIVETGPVESVIHSPAHPYTVGLMGSIPAMDEDRERLLQIDGAMPRLNAIPSGCAFHPRCPKVFGRCHVERPNLMPVQATRAACWLHAADMKAAA